MRLGPLPPDALLGKAPRQTRAACLSGKCARRRSSVHGRRRARDPIRALRPLHARRNQFLIDPPLRSGGKGTAAARLARLVLIPAREARWGGGGGGSGLLLRRFSR